jgi:hypothetical protein
VCFDLKISRNYQQSCLAKARKTEADRIRQKSDACTVATTGEWMRLLLWQMVLWPQFKQLRYETVDVSMAIIVTDPQVELPA